MRFGNEFRPSNIRIHGTMNRRIRSCADTTPLRYLVVDPRERVTNATAHNVDLKLLRRLETLSLPHNGYAKELRRLSAPSVRGATVAVELQWDEGINELAAIVHETPHVDVSSRSVLFRRNSCPTPQYLNPLSALYEPLSYPLWFPHGGRGWSTDMLTNAGRRLSHMWWYRQHLLRSPHMHLC